MADPDLELKGGKGGGEGGGRLFLLAMPVLLPFHPKYRPGEAEGRGGGGWEPSSRSTTGLSTFFLQIIFNFLLKMTFAGSFPFA